MSENNSFKMGLRDGIPIFLGYLSVSFAFGITAVKTGLTIIEALLISMTNLTSAGQLAGVPIICGGGSLIELATTQLIINLRYSLMSVSLSQKLGKSIKLLHRFLIAFGITDEVFAVSASKNTALGKKYFFGLILMPYIGWSGGTFLGAIAGNILPDMIISALGIAIYGMFIAIIIPEAKKRRTTAFAILLSALLGCAFKYIPYLDRVSAGFVIIISAIFVSVLFALIAPIEVKEAQVND
ncbi:MAG: AzlC family ABC transporter permease [Clostridia bacterium]|nr:AzlC family ABC transporter permease [Clostridia bacterium]